MFTLFHPLKLIFVHHIVNSFCSMKHIFLLIPFLVFFACSSPQKSFEKGNYNKAFSKALRKLERGDKTNKNRLILNKSLDQMIQGIAGQVEKDISRHSPDNWEESLTNIDDLLDKIDRAKPFLGSKFKEKEVVLSQYQTNLRAQLFDFYYGFGLAQLNQYQDRESFKSAQKAYLNFDKAYDFNDDNRKNATLDSLLDISLRLGTQYFVVEVSAPFDIFYQNEIEAAFSRLDGSIGLFKKVYFEKRPDFEFDCLIEIDFNSLDIKEDEEQVSKVYSKSIVVDYEEKSDTSGNTWREPIYETVSCTVNKIIHVKKLSWDVYAKVNAYSNNCDLDSRMFYESETERYEEVDFDGDERAIPDSEKDGDLLPDYNRRESEMVEDLIEKIYDEIRWYYFSD